ncbi:MAG: TonB-dependent receptor [Deltaproteobacteria bacterium]|nr:TonB-dependent receptor [Deltaproteobacteria bacterium]
MAPAVLPTVLQVVASPAYASAAGTIKGQVVDDGGLAIPGVLVTISSEKLIGGAQQYTADADGNFVFPELPPGQYKIEAQKQGFGKVTKTGVQVAVGRVTTVTLEMKYGGETVIIEEKAKAVDTEAVAHSTTFNKDYLSRIPTGRSYQSVIESAAGVIGGGNAMAAGASGDENTWVLDGVNVTDPVTGTFSTNFNYDAIEEIQVITGGFDPEYGESLGAAFIVVTSSGGNTLEVKTSAQYSNGDWAPKLDSRYAADGGELAFTGFDSGSQAGIVRMTVSGPVLRDQVWFLGSYEYVRSLYTNVGILVPQDFDGHRLFTKLTAQPLSKHRFTLTLTNNAEPIDNIDQGDPYTTPEAQPRQYQGGYVLTGKWHWFISEDANLETTASFQKTFIEISSVPCTHDEELGYNECDPGEAENTIDYTTPARAGSYGAYNTGNFAYFLFDDRWSASMGSKFSVLQVPFLGKHDFKAGVEARYVMWDQTYGYPGNLLYIDLYENSFDPDTYKNFYSIELAGYNRFTAQGYHVGAFLQDIYKPIDNLTFRYGARYDRAVMQNDVGESLIDVGVFGPRIYASWDPWGDEKTKFLGGYGRFNDVGRLELAGYLSESGFGQKLTLGEYFGSTDSTAANVYYEQDTSNTITFADPLSAPHTDELILGAEREIVTDIAAALNFKGKFTRNVYTLDETNLIYDEDGYSYIGQSYGADELATYDRLRTPGIARRDYFQTDLELSKIDSKRWFGQITYSYVSSRGTTQSSLGSQLSNPSQTDLMYGSLTSDVTHQIKAWASWEIPDDPWTTTLSAIAIAYSGYPLSRYYWSAASVDDGVGGYGLLKEPAGEYARTPGNFELNLTVQQDIPVDKGQLGAYVNMYNVTNQQASVYYSEYYIAADNRYVQYSRQSPISAELGVQYKF